MLRSTDDVLSLTKKRNTVLFFLLNIEIDINKLNIRHKTRSALQEWYDTIVTFFLNRILFILQIEKPLKTTFKS